MISYSRSYQYTYFSASFWNGIYLLSAILHHSKKGVILINDGFLSDFYNGTKSQCNVMQGMMRYSISEKFGDQQDEKKFCLNSAAEV